MPTKAELEAEVARLREALDQFTNIDHAHLVSFQDGQWEFKSPIFPVFVNTMAQMLAAVNAPSHIEMRAGHPEVGPIILTIQKEWGKTPTDLRIEAEREIERLRACAAAAPLTDGRSCRVSMDLTPEGKPCLIVTAPARWDEAKLGDIIAGTLNLWEKTAQALAEQKANSQSEGGAS